MRLKTSIYVYIDIEYRVRLKTIVYMYIQI